MSTHIERQTYDVPTIAKIIGVGRNQAYEAIRSGEIKSIRIGKRIVVSRAELDRLLNPQQNNVSGAVA